ncbi:MAG: hypothetical protein SFT94_02155 [Pseudanabaenaceae cyanobacterium bins.68]|nr:hypothetical protein [Pseudanabaenaceae cyanobacterium bins.68]
MVTSRIGNINIGRNVGDAPDDSDDQYVITLPASKSRPDEIQLLINHDKTLVCIQDRSRFMTAEEFDEFLDTIVFTMVYRHDYSPREKAAEYAEKLDQYFPKKEARPTTMRSVLGAFDPAYDA